MLLHQDEQKVHKMLTEAITMLCRNGLEFSRDIQVEGLLGITLDSSEVFLVNIKEKFLSGNSESTSGQSTEVHTSTQDNVVGSPSRGRFSRGPYGQRHSAGRQKAEGILAGPLDPMIQESPFRRQRGRRKMAGEMRWLRRRFNNPHVRMMHAMMASSDPDGDMPPFAKRQNLSAEPLDLPPPYTPSSTISSDPTQPDTQGTPPTVTSTPIKQEPEDALEISDQSKDDTMIIHSDVSLTEGALIAVPLMDFEPDDTLNETYDVGAIVGAIDPGVLVRLKRAIMKEEGCFVTVRMMCRRYSAFFKSHLVVDAMKAITVPISDPRHIGAFRCLKERSSKIFYKCPPDRMNPEALKAFNLTRESYNNLFSCLPKPIGMHSPRWNLFAEHVLASSPYGPLNLEFARSFLEEPEEVSMEPGDTMDEFDLQRFIMHTDGCFISSRILCRKLSKQYKVVNVIRAMKAMSREKTDPNYIGQFVKVSERTKIFFKAPPSIVGSNVFKLYGLNAEQYKSLYYASPRPYDDSITNWDTYVGNAMAHYPYSFENFPLECCHVSPELMERISYVGHGLPTTTTGAYPPELSGFLGILNEESNSSLAKSDTQDTHDPVDTSDLQDTRDTVERIRSIFRPELVSGLADSEVNLPPVISSLDMDPDEDII